MTVYILKVDCELGRENYGVYSDYKKAYDKALDLTDGEQEFFEIESFEVE